MYVCVCATVYVCVHICVCVYVINYFMAHVFSQSTEETKAKYLCLKSNEVYLTASAHFSTEISVSNLYESIYYHYYYYY